MLNWHRSDGGAKYEYILQHDFAIIRYMPTQYLHHRKGALERKIVRCAAINFWKNTVNQFQPKLILLFTINFESTVLSEE